MGYRCDEVLEHRDLVPFIRKYLHMGSMTVRWYYGFNLVIFVMTIGLLVMVPGSFGSRFNYLSYGLAVAFLLIPLHEYLHVLAYRYVGAGKTSLRANLKKLYFMALADGFVVNRREFRIVALTPFVLISLLFLLVLPWVAPLWKLTCAGALLAHTAMCSGDFGLLGYFDRHRDKDPLTYDDVDAGRSYFYLKE